MLNSNFLTGKIPELLEDVLERFGLEIKNYTTDEFIKALPANTSIAFAHSETVGAHLTDLPDDYGVVQILKGYTANYCNATFYGNDGYTYKYYSNSSLSTKVNWEPYEIKVPVFTGDFNDIIRTGIYYVANSAVNKPENTGGLYILSSPYNDGITHVGLYITNSMAGGVYKITCSSRNANITKIW